MNLLDDSTDPVAPTPEWVLLGLVSPGEDAEVGWVALFRAALRDEAGVLHARMGSDYRPLFFPLPRMASPLRGAEPDFSWLEPELARRMAEAYLAPAVQIRGDEERTEAGRKSPPFGQEGPTRPGGEETAESVTVGRDRHDFPDGAGDSDMANHEERRQPMLQWRNGDRRVARLPAPAARHLGPCHPVYFGSLAPYRPNRAEPGSPVDLLPLWEWSAGDGLF